MRRKIAVAVSVIFAAFCLFVVVTAITPLAYGSGGRWFRPAYDFSLRMTEIKCLRSGVNPFDVWHGDVVIPPYRPNYNSKVEGPEFNEDINAYAPWEYTFMMPLSFFPMTIAWCFYFLFMIWCMVVVFVVGFRAGRSLRGSRADGAILGAVPIVLVAYPLWSNICIGNFSVVVLAAVVLMAVCLDMRLWWGDMLAGLSWAVAMLKPQLGIAFAIPLVMRRKWIACAVAACVCALASFLPAVLCGTSPLTMILQAPMANLFMFHGCGTWPYVLCGFCSENADVLIALSIGACVCVALTRILPSDVKWLVYLMPAAVCSATWTYVSTYGHAMCWFFFFVLVEELVRNPSSWKLLVILLVASFSTTRLYNAFHGLVSAFAGRFSTFAYSEVVHYHIDSFNSTLDLLLAFALCIVIWRRHVRKDICSP